MKITRILGCVIVAVTAGSLNGVTVPKGERESRTLAKLDGVAVVIDGRDDLQTFVELRLRQVGIRVLTPEEWARSDRSPFLFVRITSEPMIEHVLSFSIQAGLRQNAWIDVVPTIQAVGAETWRTGITGIAEPDKLQTGLRDGLGRLVDEFCNDYLAANPRPPQTPK